MRVTGQASRGLTREQECLRELGYISGRVKMREQSRSEFLRKVEKISFRSKKSWFFVIFDDFYRFCWCMSPVAPRSVDFERGLEALRELGDPSGHGEMWGAVTGWKLDKSRKNHFWVEKSWFFLFFLVFLNFEVKIDGAPRPFVQPTHLPDRYRTGPDRCLAWKCWRRALTYFLESWKRCNSNETSGMTGYQKNNHF